MCNSLFGTLFVISKNIISKTTKSYRKINGLTSPAHGLVATRKTCHFQCFISRSESLRRFHVLFSFRFPLGETPYNVKGSDLKFGVVVSTFSNRKRTCG